jgi:DNA-binding response OmpR family regulator
LAEQIETSEMLNVLLIDDEPMQLSLIPLIMNHFDSNLKVEILADPSKAVEKIRNFPYDVVVADYSMPEKNGLNLIKAIKNIRDVPCILYSERGNNELVETTTNGVDDYMKKLDNPRDYSILTERIRAAVKRHREAKFR